MLALLFVSLGVTLFGFFSLYRDIVVDNFQSLEQSILVIFNGIYYGLFYIFLIVLGCKLNAYRLESVRIIRKWISQSSQTNLEELQAIAEQIEDKPIVLSLFALPFDLKLMGDLFSGATKFLFILIQFDIIKSDGYRNN